MLFKATRPLVSTLFILLTLTGSAFAFTVNLYVDAAPNVYGSPYYQPWQDATFAAVANGSFVNMSNGVNPDNVGTTNFQIKDEVVYSFGDLGSRLTWIYWIPNATINELISSSFQISLTNIWDGESMDFYDYYYGSTWMQPSKWVEYESGVIGTAGMAWWGAYGVNTTEALIADISSWKLAAEDWIFTAKVDGAEYSITSQRAPTPEPGTFILAGLGLLGLVCFRRKFTTQ